MLAPERGLGGELRGAAHFFLPALVIAHLHGGRERGRTALARGGIYCRKLVEENVAGPAVADEVVGGENEGVAFGGELDELDRQERAAGGIESAEALGGAEGREALVALGFRQGGEVDEGNIECERGGDRERFARGIKCRAERIVVGNDLPDAVAQCVEVEIAVEVERPGFVAGGVGGGALLGEEPDSRCDSVRGMRSSGGGIAGIEGAAVGDSGTGAWPWARWAARDLREPRSRSNWRTVTFTRNLREMARAI